VRAVDQAYVRAWLNNDQAAVLATLADDAVLMPAGQYPLRSRDEIVAFWWPQDGSTTRILAFERAIDEIEVQGDMAMVRGVDSVTFEYSRGATPSKQTSRSMTLAIYRRQPGGSWRISRMMWGARSK
jgi:ketosteroid isomerase-like protein